MKSMLELPSNSKYKVGFVACLVSYLGYCLYETLSVDNRSLNNTRNNRKYKTKGLKRTNGVTCYLNSIFLILSNSSGFITYTNDIHQAKKKLLKNKDVIELPLHDYLHDVLIQLLIDDPGRNISEGLYLSREKIYTLERILNFSLLKQNDWLEVLEKMIHTLDKERNLLSHASPEARKISSPFEYKAKLSNYCAKCRQSAEKGSQLNKQNDEESYLLINLDFAYKKSDYKNLTLVDLIERSMYQQIEDYTCSYCTLSNYISTTKDTSFDLKNICINTDLGNTLDVDVLAKYQVKTTLIKKQDIISYPKLLFFNLNRFSYSYSGISNRDTSTYFHFDKTISMRSNSYQLNTLIKHSGNARVGGHYQVFNRKPIVVKEKVGGEVKYHLKCSPETDDTISESKGKDIDLANKLSKDYWLINDDRVKDKSLFSDINPYDSNMIVGLVYERVS